MHVFHHGRHQPTSLRQTPSELIDLPARSRYIDPSVIPKILPMLDKPEYEVPSLISRRNQSFGLSTHFLWLRSASSQFLVALSLSLSLSLPPSLEYVVCLSSPLIPPFCLVFGKHKRIKPQTETAILKGTIQKTLPL